MVLEIFLKETYIKIEIVDDYNKILKALKIGINIPIPQFRDYIIDAFNKYNVRGILLKEKQNKELSFEKKEIITGVTVIFNEDSETLFFGFFGVCDQDSNKIQELISALLNFAKIKNFKYIKGPINIPTIIFGFGFETKGLDKKLCIGKPINPPIYLDKFFEEGFYIKHTLDSYSIQFKYLNVCKYDFSSYEYINPGKKKIGEYLQYMIKLHVNNIPKYSQVTPNPHKNATVVYKYLIDTGKDYLGWIVRHKASNNIVGCGYLVSDPFSERILSFEQLIVDKNHQGKGLAIFMLAKTMQLVLDQERGRNIKGIMSIAINNKKIKQFVKRYLSAIRERRHLVLEYKL